MGRTPERGSAGAPVRAAAVALLALAVAVSACAFRGPSTRTDRAFAVAPPAAWGRIAVLPFDGAPELCRPAEELLALRIRHQRRIGIVPPLAAQRALAAGRAAPGQPPVPAPSPAAWISGRADAQAPLVPGPSAAEVRALAARLAVDGVVAGAVMHDATWYVPGGPARGAVVEVVLFDAGGAPVAVLRRQGGWEATRDGIHEAAMDATGRVADDLLAVLLTPPGGAPAVLVAPPEPAPAE